MSDTPAAALMVTKIFSALQILPVPQKVQLFTVQLTLVNVSLPPSANGVFDAQSALFG